jgi:hypothetical protein
VRNQIRFTIARLGFPPVIEGAHGNLPAYGGGKSGASAPASGSHYLHFAEQPIDGHRTYPQNKWPPHGDFDVTVRRGSSSSSASSAKKSAARAEVIEYVGGASLPVLHGVLLLLFILKECLLKLIFDADEPFFGTRGTVPKIICFLLECACSVFGCAQL